MWERRMKLRCSDVYTHYYTHVLLIDKNLLLFHITNAWNHEFIMLLPHIAFFVEDESNDVYNLKCVHFEKHCVP